VSPRTGLDDLEEKSFIYQNSNLNPSVVQPVASRYTDCAINERTNRIVTSGN
jgi:hypothetical protein